MLCLRSGVQGVSIVWVPSSRLRLQLHKIMICFNKKKKKKNQNSNPLLISWIMKLQIQAPKVKLGDRITALQQIVSPFGKVNTYIHMYTRYESTHLASWPYHNSYTVEFILLNPTSDVLNGEDCSNSRAIFRHIIYHFSNFLKLVNSYWRGIMRVQNLLVVARGWFLVGST